MSETLSGLVTRSQSGFYHVETEKGAFTCHLRGLLKRGRRLGDLIAVGDRVIITPLRKDTGVVERIEERQRMISRLAPDPQGSYQQIIIANPDQAVFVFACAQPEPRYGMLDRFLVIAEKQAIPALIIANKADLVGEEAARALYAQYPNLGYGLLVTSVNSGLGLAELRQRLSGKISVFAGPSGVGKSSLLNALLPHLALAAQAVSRATLKGRHTTVVREMYPLPEGGYVADTPGLKALALWDIEPEELDAYFPELRQHVTACQFNDCTHVHEPGCAVLQALEAGEIHPLRYQSYRRMRLGEEE